MRNSRNAFTFNRGKTNIAQHMLRVIFANVKMFFDTKFSFKPHPKMEWEGYVQRNYNPMFFKKIAAVTVA